MSNMIYEAAKAADAPSWFIFESRVMRRVAELSAAQHPAFNVAPLIELVRQAHSMGYDIVPLVTGDFRAHEQPEA